MASRRAIRRSSAPTTPTTCPHRCTAVTSPPPAGPLGPVGTPTGTVSNGPGGFQVSGFSATGAPTSAPARFVFVTEAGTIVGWNPGVNPKGFDPAKAGTYGILAIDNSG